MYDVNLEISALTSGPSQKSSYTLLLADKDTGKKLAIVIGTFEAQAIALVMEDITPQRPLTHDLFKNFASVFQITLKEVLITNLVEGVFFATLVCEKDGNVTELDARTSDAIALAVRYNCPIRTSRSIMDAAGIDLEEIDEEPQAEHVSQSTEDDPFTPSGESNLSLLSDEELNAQLGQAIENEDYDLAAEIRDELNRRK
jgi:bifunctional DNase/RNase